MQQSESNQKASILADELLNHEDSTFRWESRSLESERAICHSGSALSGQCSKIGENRGSDRARDSGERIPSNFVINGVVSESKGCRRVVYLHMRKIFEKLKSLYSLSRLGVVSWASTRDQGRALSTENEAGALGIFDNPWQDGSEDAVQFWHDEGGPDSLASAVEDESRQGKGHPARPPRAGGFWSSVSTVGWKMLGTRTCVYPHGLCRDNRQAFRGWGALVFRLARLSPSWSLCQPTTPHRHCALRRCHRVTVQRRVCHWRGSI